jgi:ATP-binding cassette subfamily B protein
VRAKDTQGSLLRLWHYLERQRWALVIVTVLVTVTTALSLAGPYLMGVAIDQYIAKADRAGLAQIVLLMMVIYVAQSGTTWIQSILMIRVSQETVRELRWDLFAKLQTLSLRFFDQRPHGELMSRLTNDIENVNAVLSENVTSFLSSVLTLIGVVIMMLALNIPLALISMIVVPLMVLLTRYIARHSRQGFRDQQESLGVLNGLIEETISGGKVIRAYGREEAVIGEFERSNQRLRDTSIRAQTYAGFLGPGGNLINNFGFVVVASVGGWMAIKGWATVGIIASFLTYAQQLRNPINQIASLFNSIQSALAGAERVFEVQDEIPEIEDVSHAVSLETTSGDVAFDQVSFGYKENVPVLKHVSLHAEPGQTVALVGPTGAGKTTIINLLSRFYDVDAGTIQIDGHDIRDVKKADLRRHLGIVLQDTFLFSESVMENIRYGRLEATDEEVIAAAKMANADHFIRRLPQGYHTILSERAGNLSQGQRQLLAIARAILANPGILILDEATSSVDTRTESQIQEAMLRLMEGRTSFVIAHRLSTIRDADNILVIRDGEIVESGTHAELLEHQGFYHHLYMSQFKGTQHLLATSEASAAAPTV